ncbi:helix-turn-helix domain-containing protein [Marixanthomonas ophiurae]|uniref:AraC family transcriptional regulator n=1 Tax=Marixanthomonas ophiurae TaxID=387659 RepID=A0A3E1Q6Q1_9FLAO|nr:helix-turn-helix domain-containing protein [Marixanthomonas ophiurae]RFN57799.1 AraC family transcriptional regulator [Marixanthomonas ophiurae]
MQGKFIERGTDYPLKNGKLSIYETNCSCKDIQFHFNQYVLTVMLSGHKTIVSDNLKLEFFPGMLFIPEKEVINHVSIPNASIYNPTKCLVLELNPSFLKKAYEEILYSEANETILHKSPSSAETTDYFISNDQLLIQAFMRLYDIQSQDHSDCKPLVEDLIIKEILYRLFNTQGIELLKNSFEKSIPDANIRKVTSYIRHNIGQKLTIESLTNMAGMGQTTFFKLFKESTGATPIEYILQERIRQAKIMIQKGRLNLQEIAFKSGFNSYEYFCSSFKKLENIKPSEFKKQEKYV